jgi:hypothetical protein
LTFYTIVVRDVYGGEETRYSSNGLNSDFLIHIWGRNRELVGDGHVFTSRIFRLS